MRRLALSFLQLGTASLIAQAIGFAVLAVVARRIGAANLGAYAFAATFINYFALPIVPGLSMLTVRSIARDKPDAPRIAGRVVPILAVYSILMALVVYLIAPVIAPTPVAANMLRILAVTMVILALTPDWLLQGREAFRALAVVRLLGQVFYGLAAAVFVTSGLDGAYRYAWLNAFGFFVTLAAAWLVCLRLIGRPTLSLRLRQAGKLVKESAPFTLSLSMVALYYTADFVLLGFLSTSADVGQYTVAYRLPLAFLTLSSLWITVFYPHAASERPERLLRQIGHFTTLSWILVAPLCAGALVLGEPLMVEFFGKAYQPAGQYFSLLMIAVGLAAIDTNIGQILLATGHERRFSVGVTLGAICNVALNFALIPALGPAGSALATIAAEAVVLVFMIFSLRVFLGVPRLLWNRIASATVSAAIMVGVLLTAFPSAPVLGRVGMGAAVYALAVVATGGVRVADYRRLYRPSVAS